MSMVVVEIKDDTETNPFSPRDKNKCAVLSDAPDTLIKTYTAFNNIKKKQAAKQRGIQKTRPSKTKSQKEDSYLKQISLLKEKLHKISVDNAILKDHCDKYESIILEFKDRCDKYESNRSKIRQLVGNIDEN